MNKFGVVEFQCWKKFTKGIESFQRQWHCQQISSKCTSLSSARQIYHWPAHNSVNFRVCLFSFHYSSHLRICHCLKNAMFCFHWWLTIQQWTEFSMLNILPDIKIPVLYISLFSAKSRHNSCRKVPCFTKKVMEWYKHMFQIHNFPWWQDQSYSSANYMHCSAKLSVTVHNFTIHRNSHFTSKTGIQLSNWA